MIRVLLQIHDRFCFELIDKAKSDDMFGEDYLEDYGVEISHELLERYKANMEVYEKLQVELHKEYIKLEGGA